MDKLVQISTFILGIMLWIIVIMSMIIASNNEPGIMGVSILVFIGYGIIVAVLNFYPIIKIKLKREFRKK